MAKISQKTFSWKEIEEKGDLERLELALEYLPDEELMNVLEAERKNGRNRYPIRALWNSIIAGIIFQHRSINGLIRELKRNPLLKEICGFNPLQKIPKAYVYSRFFKKLLKHYALVQKLFQQLVKKLQKELPDFGENLVGDGKAVQTFAAANKNNHNLPSDGRRDNEADFGAKKYSGIDENGKYWSKIKSWFGYKFHIIGDATYELPIAFEVTKASCAEGKEMKKLLEKLEQENPEILNRCVYASFDRGYDDKDLIKKSWDEYGIKPIIDIRNMWRDGEKTRVLLRTTNIVYDYRGEISCYCSVSGEKKEMAYSGFEKKRNTLKYRCPVQAYGITCKGQEKCLFNKGLRIDLEMNRRVFTPLPRSSYK